MRKRQQGITAIGFVILAAIVAVIGFAALKLTPVYLEHMKVVSLLGDIEEELDGQNATPREIRTAIAKRINIEMINALKAQDFTIKKTENGYTVRAEYERSVPYLGNLFLLAKFNDAVEIQR